MSCKINKKSYKDSYTEEITDLSARVSGKKFTNTALAGLAAREDLQNVRLRSASRKREDQSVRAHIVVLKQFFIN